MQKTLMLGLDEAVREAALWEVDKPREEWLFGFPAELALLAGQVQIDTLCRQLIKQASCFPRHSGSCFSARRASNLSYFNGQIYIYIYILVNLERNLGGPPQKNGELLTARAWWAGRVRVHLHTYLHRSFGRRSARGRWRSTRTAPRTPSASTWRSAASGWTGSSDSSRGSELQHTRD